MSKKANPALIGAFTLIGLLIAAAAVVVLGAGKYFERTHEILMFFDKSAMGLQVGSDVRFGGVRIGRVNSINVLIDVKENRKIIPVVVELGERELRLVSRGDGRGIDFASKEGVNKAVADGLRAGMKQQSLVTGQLYIEFDIVPDSPGFVYQTNREPRIPVVPTIPTEMDELVSGIADGLKKINSLDIEGVVQEIRDVLVSAKRQLNDLNMKEINDNIVSITRDVRDLTSQKKLGSAIDHLDEVLTQLEDLTKKANEGFDPLMEDLTQLLNKAEESLAKVDSAAGDLASATNPRGPVLMRLQNVLEETDRASRSIKELANDLKRNPKSILSGKELQE